MAGLRGGALGSWDIVYVKVVLRVEVEGLGEVLVLPEGLDRPLEREKAPCGRLVRVTAVVAGSLAVHCYLHALTRRGLDGLFLRPTLIVAVDRDHGDASGFAGPMHRVDVVASRHVE